ncbi:flagellar export chaperone FlgN [Desulfovibrio inopinatus]|uniref:flagellar export chaperone FlgN n=1 Tax=Desulfovibrio inopinatus TaxID=102109 RepID=UPI00041FB41C|nr:flagellar export chaperone FlgN [Desulfovibrio inopinatus]
MNERILQNITRQSKALQTLFTLQQEEFAHLKELNPEAVSRTELSIQELMRQIAAERSEISLLIKKCDPSAKRVRDLLPSFTQEQRDEVEKSFALLEKVEQQCAKQAEKNHRLALGLFNQSQSYMSFLQKQLIPKKETYSKNGRFQDADTGPRVLRGRF